MGLLRDGLAAAGADVRLAPSIDAAALDAFRPDVIHLHWLERYDLPPPVTAAGLHGTSDLPRRALRRVIAIAGNSAWVYALRRRACLRRLFGQLRAFQTGGGRVAYTVHNLDPHEEAGAVERWGIAQILGLADAVHVHDANTAELLAARFGRRQGVVVIPHGHYLGSYPNTVGRDQARAALALPAGVFVFVSLGLLRPYKGLEELLPAFRSLPELNLRLVLAGKPSSDDYLRALETLAAGDSRICLMPRFVPPEEVQVFLNAADVCVLPYRQITTSGAACVFIRTAGDRAGIGLVFVPGGRKPGSPLQPGRTGCTPIGFGSGKSNRLGGCAGRDQGVGCAVRLGRHRAEVVGGVRGVVQRGSVRARSRMQSLSRMSQDTPSPTGLGRSGESPATHTDGERRRCWPAC